MKTKTPEFRIASFLFAAAIFGFGTSLASGATTNDLKADWSDTQNPNGVWSYNEGANPLPHSECAFRNCAPFTCCLPAWSRGEVCPTQGGSSPVIPAWYKVPDCLTNVYDLQVEDISMHSRDDANGGGNGEGNVTWRANANGFVTVSGGIWDAAKFLGRGNHWSIRHNGTLLTEGEVSSGDSYNRAAPFDFQTGTGGSNVLQNIPVNAGDVIRLTITRTSQHGALSGINFTLISALEPIDGPALRIQLHPGISVFGTTGKTYRVEYVAQAGNTNWTTLTNVLLLSSPHLLFDPQPATLPARLYRAVEIP